MVTLISIRCFITAHNEASHHKHTMIQYTIYYYIILKEENKCIHTKKKKNNREI